MSEAQPPQEGPAPTAPAQAAATATSGEPKQPTALIQMLYDDVFLMLLLGLIVPLVFYTIWGFLELMSVPLSS